MSIRRSVLAGVRGGAVGACVAAGLLVLGGSPPAHAVPLLHGWTVVSTKAFTATPIVERSADEIDLTLTYTAAFAESVDFTFDHDGTGGDEAFFYITFKVTNSGANPVTQVNFSLADLSSNADSRDVGEEGDRHPPHAHIHPDLGDAWLDHPNFGDQYKCIDASTRFGDCNGPLDDNTFTMNVAGAAIAVNDTFDGKLLRIHDIESVNGDMKFQLTVKLVPEPSTALLLASALAALSARRRRE